MLDDSQLSAYAKSVSATPAIVRRLAITTAIRHYKRKLIELQKQLEGLPGKAPRRQLAVAS